MILHRLSAHQWSFFSEDAHKIAFDKRRDPAKERIDYALLVVNPRTDKPAGYVTCREQDAETVYWQFGGLMPETLGTPLSIQVYLAFINYARSQYKRVNTLIENTNTAMLRPAMKVGFRIVGIKNYHGSILLEHCLEFG